jgi:hypothetical protein
MTAAAIIALILKLAPGAINLGMALKALIAHHNELQNKPNRSEVEDAELNLTQQVIEALQAHIDQKAREVDAGNG